VQSDVTSIVKEVCKGQDMLMGSQSPIKLTCLISDRLWMVYYSLLSIITAKYPNGHLILWNKFSRD